MIVVRWLLCAALLTAAALAQNQPPAPHSDASATSSYPNVILITLDTTRADRMGFLGSKRALTPNLDLLAPHSAIFTHAYSQVPLTPGSHATILTGTYPQYHQVLTFPIPLGKDIPFLPDILKSHGYTTGAFVGSLAVDPSWGTPGFERGFDIYDAGYTWQNYTPKTRYQTTQRRGAEVVQRALAWLNKRPPGPFFLWVHLFDAHDPYTPPEPYLTRYKSAPYDGGIAYEDFVVGKLLTDLKAHGLYDGTLIAITADHGESLGAHGENTHGIFVYDETIHVPLLIKLPHDAAAGRRIDNPVELADIMPTVLQELAIAVPDKVQGQSLLGFIEPSTPAGQTAAKNWHDRGAYSQADYGHLAFAWSALQSLRTEKYTYIQAPRRELYAQAVDPKAEHNLASTSPAVADTLSAQLETFKQKTTNTGETPKARLDANKANKLAALGYMATRSDVSLENDKDKGADPKDKIQIANTILKVNSILEDWRCDKAIPELKKAVITAPEISMLHFFLGGCYLEKEDYEKAAPELRKAVQLNPGFTHAETNLGRSLMRIGDWEGAATAFEHVTKTEPEIMDSHVFLVVIYAKLNRVQDEIRECRTVLAVVPEHFGSNLNLGVFLAKSGDLQGAIPSLQKAASIRPTVPDPHLFLADVYSQLGREDDANRERAEAERLGAVPTANNSDAPPTIVVPLQPQ